MSRFYSYINSAKNIIENYNGETPLAIFLKKYFNISKKYGSKDRKQIAGLVYNFYRISLAVKTDKIDEKLLIATFLCESKASQILENIRPEWNEKIENSLAEKIKIIDSNFDENNVFPFSSQLSKSINTKEFSLSFLKQPKLFLRIRPGYNDLVLSKLTDECINFSILENDCISLPNGSKIDEVLRVGKEVIVQDYSSQQVGKIIEKYIEHNLKPIKIWDCCAASGGKSIMLYDINSQIELTVSDIRESILENLKERFAEAGIKKYKSQLIDLKYKTDFNEKFDIILADVPCTGSGTWARTPEQLYFFTKEKIAEYADLQYSIIKNSLPNLKNDGILIYITCSVFEKENEAQVQKISENFNLKLISQKNLIGYQIAADSMFVAVLQKI